MNKEIYQLPQKFLMIGTTVKISGQITVSPLTCDAKAQEIIEIYRKIVKDEFKQEVTEWLAGGISDGNLAAEFIPTIDALGVDIYNYHTNEEIR